MNLPDLQKLEIVNAILEGLGKPDIDIEKTFDCNNFLSGTDWRGAEDKTITA